MIGIRGKIIGAVVVPAMVVIAGCAGEQLGSTGISEKDAYAIGCPAIDSSLATGSVANKATTAGLRQLRDHAKPSAETRSWIDASLALLESADAKKIPRDARKLIVNGCQKNGYSLKNLKK